MDRHPNQDKISALPTQPPLITTPVHRSRPGVLAQLGRALSYTSIGEQFVVAGKPSTYQLAAWDEARRKEPVQGWDVYFSHSYRRHPVFGLKRVCYVVDSSHHVVVHNDDATSRCIRRSRHRHL